MLDHDGANTNMSASGLGSEEAQYLDSPELETKFLAAIGFQNGAKNLAPKSNPASTPATRPQDVGPVFENGPKARKARINPTQSSHVQSPIQGNVSSKQWRQTTNQPAPLTTTYWEAQRIAKGMVNPWAYPGAYGQIAWGPAAQWEDQPCESNTAWMNNAQGRGKNKEGPSGEYREMTLPEPFTEKPTPPQSRTIPIASQYSWVEPQESTPSSRPSIQQSFVPAHPQPNIGAPEGLRYRAGADKQGSNGTGPLNTDAGRGRQPVSGPDQINHHSPDLTAYRMPRPDRNYPGSSLPSLPSLASAINISETGVGTQGAKSTGAKPRPDVRNTIGLKPNIHKSGNIWMAYNWADPQGRDWDEDLRESSYLSRFIFAWVNEAPYNILTSFHQGIPDHWRCDIDTNTGCLLPPVRYPDTMVDHSQVDPGLEWRRQNWTSTLLIRRHHANPRRNWRFGQNSNHRHNPPNRVVDEPDAIDESLIITVHEPKLERPEFNCFVPRVPCFLRPADKRDIEAMRLIYNWEIEHGFQALDSQPLTTEDFEKTLITAQRLDMPFIVAERGSARELGLSNGNILYSAFRQIPFCESDKQGEILGFAFLSVWQPGLAGSGSGSSRASAKIHVYVHRDYRRKKIGFSLLDMLLTSVSDRFSSQSGYDFIDPDNNPAYKNSPARERQYFKLYLSYRIKHNNQVANNENNDKEKEADDELVWVRKLLEEQFNFTELVRLEAVHRSAKCREGPVCWLDEILFEHTCGFDPEMIKEGY